MNISAFPNKSTGKLNPDHVNQKHSLLDLDLFSPRTAMFGFNVQHLQQRAMTLRDLYVVRMLKVKRSTEQGLTGLKSRRRYFRLHILHVKFELHWH